MIEKQGGQLHVTSSLNQGATFTFTMAKREMGGLVTKANEHKLENVALCDQ